MTNSDEVTDSKIHFGAQFEIESENRLDPLEKRGVAPKYVQFARRDIRGTLRLDDSEAWPELPDSVSGVEAFFGEARKVVTRRWKGRTMPMLAAACKRGLSAIPNGPESSEIRALLSNPEMLEAKMEIRQYQALEGLRSVCPEIWRMLVMSSSERQLACVELARHWVKEMSEERARSLGMSKSELEWFIGIPSFLGKYIDHGYLKQMEQADKPGGSVPSAISEEQGGKRVYDILRQEDEEVQRLSYAEAFPFEIGRFSKMLMELKRKTEARLAAGELPQSYAGMAKYLEKMALAYSSRETDPSSLNRMWEDELAAEAGRLAQEGCPIVLIPQTTAAVAGAADKIDIELRLGLRTPEVVELERISNRMANVAQGIVDRNVVGGEDILKVPPVILTSQPFAFGPNLYWMTRGESSKAKIVSHVNNVAEVAISQELPLLKKMFGLGNVDAKAYSEWSKVETILHEIGHSVFSTEDKKVGERTGSGVKSVLVEELKADALAMEILLSSAREGIDLDIGNQFWAKLGGLCDYLANKSDDRANSGGRYYYVAAKLVSDLFAAGAIRKVDQAKYEVVDPRLGVETIARVGREVVSIYANPGNGTEERVEDYADRAYVAGEDPLVREFISALKAK